MTGHSVLRNRGSDVAQVKTLVNEGKLFAETATGLVEVVSVSSAELARLPYDLAEGVYVVGTGSTGAAAAIGVSGERRTLNLNLLCS